MLANFLNVTMQPLAWNIDEDKSRLVCFPSLSHLGY